MNGATVKNLYDVYVMRSSTFLSFINSSTNQCLHSNIYIFLCFSLFLISCQQKSEYERRLETELSKDTRVDSLFLGYSFGMTSNEFFKYSWDLNNRGVITGQTKVNYKVDDLKNPATMDFFPEFKNGKIYKMPAQIQYDGWAPWNRNLFADSLMLDVVDLYEEKYDGEFFKAIHPETQKEAFINIQGNRRISIFKNDDRIITIEFLDLSAIENNS